MLACGRDKNSSLLTVEEMKAAMKEINFQIDAAATPHEIEELYHAAMAAHKKSPHQQLSTEVSFPLQLSSYLSTIQPMFSFKWENGATFFGSKEKVSNNDLLDVLDLFATMVKFENRKYTDYDSPIYKVVPSIIVDIAHKSRIDSGFCLLARCLHHAFDLKAPPLIGSSSLLF